MSFPDRFDHNNRHSSYDLESLRIAFDDWNEKSKSELLEDKVTARPDFRMECPRSRAVLNYGTSGMRPMKYAAGRPPTIAEETHRVSAIIIRAELKARIAKSAHLKALRLDNEQQVRLRAAVKTRKHRQEG
ncbi:hypothetical protein [Rhizobium mongolense]|uniref:Uncharacterized protein n=3 Tax=Rhizobium mongolense TaxID=57676 RepID=A0A7W6RPI3_9HYPH|nr:hypothetical protein [Rhizobium mongolense]MBB4226280.1 hypothetical protein [Rhizobium mongolense]MBB4276264.1 hypothetical protein [Rhizobium mongolense]TVZ73571.1 hypothetical protein BCL32_1806 [Rhizobium mongolense USDA 1844]